MSQYKSKLIRPINGFPIICLILACFLFLANWRCTPCALMQLWPVNVQYVIWSENTKLLLSYWYPAISSNHSPCSSDLCHQQSILSKPEQCSQYAHSFLNTNYLSAILEPFNHIHNALSFFHVIGRKKHRSVRGWVSEPAFWVYFVFSIPYVISEIC